MKHDDFSIETICRVYFGMYKTVGQLPFSGRHWLEQFMLEIVHRLLDDHKNEYQFTSKKPVDVCRNYFEFLNKLYTSWVEYQLEESGDNLLVHLKCDNCVYQNFCLQVQAEGLPFFCIRLGSMQAALRVVLGEIFSTSVEIDEEGICHGKLFHSTQPKEEIVIREGNTLKIAGRRAVLFPQEIYASLMTSIREHAPHAIKHVLFDAGYQSGLYTANKARVLYPDIEECLRFLLTEVVNTGFGKAELVSLDLTRATAKIRCYDSFQVAVTNEYGQLYRTPQVICDLLRGVFAAYLSVLLEKEIICEEMSCQSAGGDFCEFLAMPLPQEKGSEEKAQWVKE
ncbi:MAG: V4R domain protein [Pelotomaculum sp. PtaB.Bin104]|nr:MAG: V4R domain protein [Pelotomaculum sp. PtaB.Bin104]